MRFFDDVILPILVIGALFVVVVVGFGAVIAVVNKFDCANLHEVTKRKTEFRWFGGCYVEHEGEMLPYERWKLLDVRVANRK